MTQAQTNGRVRVIVGHQQRAVPEAELASQAAVDSQRAAIAQTTQAILASLPVSLADVKQFETIPFFAVEVDAAGLAALAASPLVASIHEDLEVRPSLAQSAPLVQATDAWAAGYVGTGQTVAILDTGVESSHSALSGKVVAEACYSTTSVASNTTSFCPGGASSSTTVGSGAPCSSTIAGCEHGTHVAGIAVGNASNVSGIGKGATLIAIQVFSRKSANCGTDPAPCTTSFSSDWIFGLERVYTLRNTFSIASANMSLGSVGFTATCDTVLPAAKTAIDNLRLVGIPTVVSSGNTSYTNAILFPACISTAVSVGSTTINDQVSSFSNRASFLSLIAPGGSSTSGIISSVPGNGTAAISGTSMAAPHVAGAWAILKQFRPSATVTEVLAVLRATGLGVLDTFNGFTFPRIRIKAALDSPPFAFNKSGPASGATGQSTSSVTVTWGSSSWFDSYSVCLDTSNNNQCDGTWFSMGTSLAATYSNLSSGTTYYWQARASNSAGTTLANSGTWWSFTTTAAAISNPLMSLDDPTDESTVGSNFTMSGWAVDLGAPSNAGVGVDYVHIYAYPISGYNGGVTGAGIFLGQHTVSIQRNDIAAVFGSQFRNSGYSANISTLAPGVYRVYVYGHSLVAGTFNSFSPPVDITVGSTASNPTMYIDSPQTGATLTRGLAFTISGWGVDRGVTGTTPGVSAIHVYAQPVAFPGVFVFAGNGFVGNARPDIGAVFGTRFTNSGFSFPGMIGIGQPAGVYDLYVFTFCDLVGVSGPCQARVQRVTVQ